MKKLILLMTVSLLFIAHCTRIEEDSLKSNNKDIISFEIANSIGDTEINNYGQIIRVTMPAETDKAKLTPVITVSDKASINPISGEEHSFITPMEYIVTAEDGTQKKYTVTVELALKTSKDIIKFVFEAGNNQLLGEEDIEGEIIDTLISVVLPYDALGPLVPTITHTGANIRSDNSDNGEAPDFSKDVRYTVIAADRTEQTYTVVASLGKSTDAEITAFEIEGVSGIDIDQEEKSITGTAPHGTSLVSIVPKTLEVSLGASITPPKEEAQNFSLPVKYYVTAQDGQSEQEYTVVISVGSNAEKKIKSFDFLDVNNPFANVFGVVNETDKTVSLTVPYETDVADLTPTIVISDNATISPESEKGVDFTNIVVYTVTAENGDTQQYDVTVSKDENTEKQIKSFDFLAENNPFPDVVGTVYEADKTVSLTVPYETNLADLTPTIVISSNATISPENEEGIDFTNIVVYTVTAENGDTQQYEVTVSKDENTERKIKSFDFLAENNLFSDVFGTVNETDKTISLTVPYETNLADLTPTIVISDNASVSPGNKVSMDFTDKVEYTVTAENGDTQQYDVTVTKGKNTEKEIKSFDFLDVNNPFPDVFGVVNEAAKTVSLTVPYGTDVTALAPTIIISGNATISPENEVIVNFTNNVVYTVTAQNGDTQQYTVTVIEDENTEKKIESFDFLNANNPFANVFGVVNETAKTVSLTVPYGTNVTALIPTIVISDNASVSPDNGETVNFTGNVVYTVTAQNGDTQQYTVTVIEDENTEKKIKSFDFLNANNPFANVFGDVNEAAKTVSLAVPYGTNVTALIPTIVISDNASVSPDNGETVNFTGNVVYTVTAQNGDTQQYTVTVIEGESTEKKIKSFDFLDANNPFPDVFGVVNETDKTVSLTVPYGTNVTALIPTIVISDNASVSPGNEEQVNFTNNVVYTVTAQNGDTQQYTVTVIEGEGTEKEIKSFDFLDANNPFPDVFGVVNEAAKTVSLTVPYGTDVTALIPTIVISDNASVSPGNEEQVNFTNNVVYTVTAQNGDTQQYTVTVIEDESTEKEIKSFDFLDANNPFPDVFGVVNETDKTVSLTVPYGTDVTALIPTIVISDNASVSPDNGETVNFTGNVVYTVTAQNGDTQQYTVTVIEGESTEKEIKSFDFLDANNPFPDVFGVVNETDKTVSLAVPYGTDVTALIPTIVISDNASVSPGNEEQVNFTNNVVYTVTAQNGDTQQYTVTVIEDENTEKKIESFDFLDANNPFPDVFGVVNEAAKTVSLTVPYGTNVTALIPTIVISDNASVSPGNEEQVNFTNNVVYTVTAQNGDTQQYTVTVIEDESTEKEIKSFDFLDANNPFPDVFGVVNETDKTVSLTVPYGTDVTALIPTIVISDNASVSPGNEEQVNFTNNVVYTVTAQNGDTQDYTVTVEIELNSEALITDFGINGVKNISIDDEAGTITGEVEVYGTNLSDIAPSVLEISGGASVSPLEADLQDFASDVDYIVTSQDGDNSKTYTVTITNRPTLKAVSYNNENRVGAGDFEKTNLFEISNLIDGAWSYGLSIEGNTEITGTVTVTGGEGVINNTMALDDWKGIGSDKNLSIELRLSTAGVAERSATHTNISKEQYMIKTWQDLQGMKYDLVGDYTVENDITFPAPSQTGGTFPDALPETGFDPVGNNSAFKGSFDGQNNVISKLYIKRTSGNNTGLFGYASEATIENVGIVEPFVDAKGENVGSLVGYTSGTADTNSNISNSYVTDGSIKSTSNYVGGLVGRVRNSVIITSSYATNNSVTGSNFTGGLVGSTNYYSPTTSSIITSSYATDNNVVSSGTAIGGLVGYARDITITSSYATNSFTTTGTAIGGLVGNLGTTTGKTSIIDRCYVTGSVEGSKYIGGLVGWHSGNSTIKDSYATASVEGDDNVGGLVGCFRPNVPIENCYATGRVYGTGNVGGLIGFDGIGTTPASYCYWDKASTEQDTSAGTEEMGVSSGVHLVKDGDGYIDEEEDGNGTERVFEGWSISDGGTETWQWRGNGQWPVLTWQNN